MGFILPVIGCIAEICILAVFGPRFGPNALRLDDGSTVDGPSDELLALFWAATFCQVFVVLFNVVGPCAMFTRGHVVVQGLGFIVGAGHCFCIWVASEMWPASATVTSPIVPLAVSGGAQCLGQAVLVFAAYKISGFCRVDEQRRLSPLDWPRVFKKRPQHAATQKKRVRWADSSSDQKARWDVEFAALGAQDDSELDRLDSMVDVHMHSSQHNDQYK
eukprot:CAMPEP_0175908314 /NCGR_PEP_ID=MMETSP0108-20121206/6525_1 /TAXON_ID=195067 ORGANISM="Goniomonas pacifica, Strain CCMP1869" /NCGR_SAMPLE_ID=MMETSP0108 /ASSEMBLY_ACC=CAM_ASM_000204 /LENGTH=217 /DNA_ID=CAMNT_0017230347 /DNA_START=91 /DNA_END=742 /DNA_ORIENTATION=+